MKPGHPISKRPTPTLTEPPLRTPVFAIGARFRNFMCTTARIYCVGNVLYCTTLGPGWGGAVMKATKRQYLGQHGPS